MAAGDVMVAGERQAGRNRERVLTDLGPITTVEDVGNDTGDGASDPAAQIEAANRRAAAAEAALNTERQGRTRAERTAARAVKVGQVERGASLASQVESATTAVEAAKNAYKMARETGDLDAEVKANNDLAMANARLLNANNEFERAKAGGDADPTSAGGDMTDPAGGNADNGPDPDAASRAWVQAHPKMAYDENYKAQLFGEHKRLVADGVKPNSPAYFRALDAKHSEIEGGGRRNGNSDYGSDDMNGDQGRQGRGSGGVSPSRGSANGAGPGTVKTLMGPVGVTQKADGSFAVRILDPSRKADFEEGAKISNMPLGEYILEQVKIAQEREGGGSGGLITTEGVAYR